MMEGKGRREGEKGRNDRNEERVRKREGKK